MVSPDLADILSAPSADAAVAKQRTKRIIGARDLTAHDYVETLREDKRKEELEKGKREEHKGSIRRKREKRRSRNMMRDKLQEDMGTAEDMVLVPPA